MLSSERRGRAQSAPPTCPHDIARKRKQSTAGLNRGLRRRFTDCWRERHGGCSFITNDPAGRMWLAVLLRVRTTTASALECAPWLESKELEALRLEAKRLIWSEIGQLLGLTWPECVRFRLPFRPAGMSMDKWLEKRRQRASAQSKVRMRKHRAKKKAMKHALNNITDRKQALHEMLAAGEDALTPPRRGIQPPRPFPPKGSGWVEVTLMVERTERVAAYRDPNGWPIKLKSRRVIIHRDLQRLQEKGEVEVRNVPGERGPVAFARLIRTTRNNDNTITPPFREETASAPKAYAEKAVPKRPLRAVRIPGERARSSRKRWRTYPPLVVITCRAIGSLRDGAEAG
jgi:hypothetical protein